MVKFKGEILVNRPIFNAYFDSNWDNDMYENYPRIWYSYMENGEPKQECISLGSYYNEIKNDIEIVNDEQQAAEYNTYKAAKEAAEDFKQIKKGRIVEVIRGRKVPIGTFAKVFWVGNTKYGESVGLELENGNKVFTSKSNVVTYKLA